MPTSLARREAQQGRGRPGGDDHVPRLDPAALRARRADVGQGAVRRGRASGFSAPQLDRQRIIIGAGAKAVEQDVVARL